MVRQVLPGRMRGQPVLLDPVRCPSKDGAGGAGLGREATEGPAEGKRIRGGSGERYRVHEGGCEPGGAGSQRTEREVPGGRAGGPTWVEAVV